MSVIDETETITFLGGIMVVPLRVDGAAIRAGITMSAFEHLLARVGFDPAETFGPATRRDDMIRILKPVIENHLQAKHMRQGASVPLIIERSDLITN